MSRATIQRVATPTAILVGLPDDVASMCVEVLSDGGLRPLRVGHVAAASERIPVVMPQVVVFSSTLRPEELDSLDERCVAVGAEVIRVAPGADLQALKATLTTAATNAMIKMLSGGG